MPFKHEHSARLQNPKKFEPESFRRNDSPVFGKKLPAGAEAIWAKTKGRSAPTDPIIPQAIRFPDDTYTETEAKKWLDDNGIKYILFEPSEKIKESILQEIEDIGTYRASGQSDKVLTDDLKLVTSWYTTLKTKGEFKYDEDQLLHLAAGIVKEILRRGKLEFHPDIWQEQPKELYSKVFKGLYSQGINVPENVKKFLDLKECLQIDSASRNFSESKHRKDLCMHCNKKPEYVVLWAEGHGRAWFCESCLKEWATIGDGRGDINSVKNIKDGEVLTKWADNTNPNIWEKLKVSLNIIEQSMIDSKEWDLTFFSGLDEGVRPAFGSPGGKRFLAKTIVGYIPDHKTYVEPFAGGAAVFFAKKPSESEILNDKNPEIAFSYKYIKDRNLDNLKKFNWVIEGENFKKLKSSDPKNEEDRFYKFAYLRLCSYGSDETGTVNKAAIGREKHLIERLPKIKSRLSNAKIYDKDYSDILKEFDSKDTFFYFDSPYTGDNTNKFKINIDWNSLVEELKKIKGKFILSCHIGIRESFKDFHIVEVDVIRTLDIGKSGRTPDKELLVSNFPLRKSNTWLAEFTEEPKGKTANFILRCKKDKENTNDMYEILIESGKDALDRLVFSCNFLEQNNVEVLRKTMNIQTPNGEPFQEWMDFEGQIPPANAKLTKVKIIDIIEE